MAIKSCDETKREDSAQRRGETVDEDSVYVTRPFMPPIDEFIPYLRRIWESKILTNNGPIHREFESQLGAYLNVQELSLVSSGTIGLLLALRALGVASGEVITTPFSFIATSNAINWAGLTPVFADTQVNGFNIDPESIERAITKRTTAIMPVHCYGYPCDTRAIDDIAARHGLKVIYDAAHAFGVEDDGGSILRHGDAAVLSFHATKVFTTLEGGAVICRDPEVRRRVDYLRNFGILNETTVAEPGINGKLNEMSSAFGALQLLYVDRLIEQREQVDINYRERLGGIPGVALPPLSNAIARNYAYFPILVGDDALLSRDELNTALRCRGVVARRYFYPLITDHPAYQSARKVPSRLQNANRIAREVLCLPMYPDMSEQVTDAVVREIRSCCSDASVV